MPRKKVFKSTSPLRYANKMHRVMTGEPHPHYSQLLSSAMQAEWMSGYGKYKDIYPIIKPILADHRVPPAQYALYRAFAFELYNKVILTKKYSVDDIIDSWRLKGGLDETVMRDIADRLGVETPPEQTAVGA